MCIDGNHIPPIPPLMPSIGPRTWMKSSTKRTCFATWEHFYRYILYRYDDGYQGQTLIDSRSTFSKSPILRSILSFVLFQGGRLVGNAEDASLCLKSLHTVGKDQGPAALPMVQWDLKWVSDQAIPGTGSKNKWEGFLLRQPAQTTVLWGRNCRFIRSSGCKLPSALAHQCFSLWNKAHAPVGSRHVGTPSSVLAGAARTWMLLQTSANPCAELVAEG